MKLLNLGCGKRYHKDWINIDFISSDKYVIAHNLLDGIPLGENEVDVVYHAHILEHFTKEDGKLFIRECYRVLKPGGIIRVVVPDLEMIARNYLTFLEKAKQGDAEAAANYEWTILEMYDQTVRNKSGGNTALYLYQEKLINEEFIYSRWGEEAKKIRNDYKQHQQKITQIERKPIARTWKRFFNPQNYIIRLNKLLKRPQHNLLSKQQEIGRFRLGGEIHQWMYDSYSLKKLLFEAGFISAEQKTAFESKINDWNTFELEAKNGVLFKPDSLFIEAIKP